MKIVIDLLFIVPCKNRGTQTYVDSLLAELTRLDGLELVCLTNKLNHAHYTGLGLNCHLTPVHGGRTITRVLYQQCFSSWLARRLGGDILFCPGYLSPMLPVLRTVPVLHDMNYKDIAGAVSTLMKLAYSIIVPIALRTATQVITVSHFSKTRIVELLGIRDEHISVVHEGPLAATVPANSPDWESLQKKYSLVADCFLSVSSGAPHKNIVRLVQGFLSMKKKTGSDVQLVMLGHSLSQEVEALLRDYGPSHGVVSTGYVPEAEKVAFFRHSLAYVFPSLYEGFGLPVLEAQSCGLPLAASRYASLPEVAGEGALYFDALDPQSIAQALEQLYLDSALRERLSAAGYENVAQFSWKRAAEETRAVLLEAARR